MVKKSKRKQDIKSKLVAAIAMLMVATIMMVSSTYAWFTLSTAPEVQGITTNVGSNGNLEIALSPASGDAADVGSSTNDSLQDWIVKNLTWGNQLNLSDSSYGLQDIKLLPAQLNLGNLANAPLKTPVYGADGRIQELASNTSIGGLKAGKVGYVIGGDYGVRVVGTSSSRTEYQIAFQNNFSAMNSSVKAAHELAQISLNANGAALAEIAIAHANAPSGNDTNEYITYVPSLVALINKLQDANDELEAAIRAALLATASSNLLGDDADDADAISAYNSMKALVIADNDLTTIWGQVSGISTQIADTPIGNAYTVWKSNDEKLGDAADDLDTQMAKTDTDGVVDVAWNDISGIIGNLMNTNGVKINNVELGTFRTQVSTWRAGAPDAADYKDGEGNWTATGEADYNAALEAYNTAETLVNDLTGGVALQLGEGSGIYADLAKAVGNIHGSVEDVKVTVDGMGTLRPDVTIDTTTGNPSTTIPYLVVYKTALQTLGALEVSGTDTDAVIDVQYAYIVDFLFRTNASGSNLMLQTEKAQRIYDDSNYDKTLGGGSTMTFYSTELNEQAVKGLMDAIRVVFIDTVSGDLLGVAKLDMNEVTSEAKTVDGESVNAITAFLHLYNYTQDASGKLTFTTQIAADNATLCALQANTAKAVSAMVYLDGDYVTNEHVAAEADSMTGTLNLQFASDADLVPMENAALKNGETTANP